MVAQKELSNLEEDKLAIDFTCNSGHCPVFSFTGTLWYCSLLLWFLEYKGIFKIHTKIGYWLSWITTGVPITITKGF